MKEVISLSTYNLTLFVIWMYKTLLAIWGDTLGFVLSKGVRGGGAAAPLELFESKKVGQIFIQLYQNLGNFC